MRRALLAVGVGLIAAGGVGAAFGSSSAAPPSSIGAFTVEARADALAIQVVDPAAPLFPNGEITDATPATAQALVDSLGESTAFASSPYPGDAIAGLPSLFNGLGGGGGFPPLPPYPFLVSSSYPAAPSSDQTQGPYRMSASSGATSSSALAQIGAATGNPAAAAARATASAAVDPATGALTAVADDTIDALSFGSVLTIGDVSSHARWVAVPGHSPQTQSSFSVGTVTVAGVTAGFTDKGFQLGGSSVPSLNPGVLNSVLAGAGITVSYLPEVRTPTSIESAGLAITRVTNVPSQGAVKVTLTLGRISLSASSSAVSLPAIAPAVLSSNPPPLASAVSAPTPARTLVVPGPPVVERTPTPVNTAPAAVTVVLAQPFLGHSSFYLVLLVAGLVILLATAVGSRRRPAGPSVLRLP